MNPPVPLLLSSSGGAAAALALGSAVSPTSGRLNPKSLPPWLWGGTEVCPPVPVSSLVLDAVTCLETRKGEQSQPQALLPAAQEIKLS